MRIFRKINKIYFIKYYKMYNVLNNKNPCAPLSTHRKRGLPLELYVYGEEIKYKMFYYTEGQMCQYLNQKEECDAIEAQHTQNKGGDLVR